MAFNEMKRYCKLYIINQSNVFNTMSTKISPLANILRFYIIVQ